MKTVTAIREAAEAYSLTEFLIALMCAIILISAAIPNVSQLQRQWGLWSSARMLEASLQWGRMHAISANTSIIFVVGEDRQTVYWMDGVTGAPYLGSNRKLPGNVRITSSPKRPLRFYQHGNAAPAGTFTVEGDAGSYSVIVAPGGRIRIQKN